MPINKNEFTKEMIAKAVQCETAEDLIAYAKSEGIDITKEKAEAYLDAFSEYELKDGDLKYVAGGGMSDEFILKISQKLEESYPILAMIPNRQMVKKWKS